MAEILRTARESKEWSVRELARQSGVSAATISKLENGELKNPTFTTVILLANHLDLRADSFEALFSDKRRDGK